MVVALFVFLNWYIAPNGPGERKDLVLGLAQILGGTALLSGLYFTWRTLQVNREGQITDRFTRAIDQLGAGEGKNKSLEIRLGGIYALERIAKESPEDHWPIMEILTAYVRHHARRVPDKEDAAGEQAGDADAEHTSNDTPRLDPDIQAIMTVIRRRAHHLGDGEPEPLDLHETNLPQANLQEAYLQEAYLYEALLEKAYLQGADLQGALLDKAYLQGAVLWKADLQEARLQEANLRRAILYGANLRGAFLDDADLQEAYLRETNLRGVDLSVTRNLTSEQLAEAVGDEHTRLPDYIDEAEVRTSWGVKSDKQTEGETEQA